MLKFLGLISLTVIGSLWLFSRPPYPKDLPKLDPAQWWGPKELRGKTNNTIRPYKIEFSEKMITDLKQRLDNFRAPPPPLEGVAFNYGFNSAQLEGWRSYWKDQYPFEEREKFLNQFLQFKTNIQGLDIHFIRVKPEVPAGIQVLPLLMLHGWPGSVAVFYEAIRLLTRQAPGNDFAFEVIAPSLPGFGFSDPAVRPGLGSVQMAVVLRNLMHRLGHKQFYLHGDDWGANIGTNMAILFPDELLGLHSSLALLRNSRTNILTVIGALFPSLVVPPHQTHRLYPLMEYFQNLLLETSYYHKQATKPDTVGVGLTDSPMGLLAYILEKFSTGTRKEFRDQEDGGLQEFFSKDRLLDNLMVYWVSGAITTSMRLYAESNSRAYSSLNINSFQTPVPIWVLQANNAFYHSPTMLRTKFINLLNVTELPDGGHFIAIEQPKTFSGDVFKAVKAFRLWHGNKGSKTEL